jgi:hypothetical protein
MIDFTSFLLGSVVTVVVAVAGATGRPFWWPWLQRSWGRAQLATLNTQLSRLEVMLNNPAQRLANATRYASNRTMGMLLVMFGMTMVVLVGVLAGVQGNVHNGVVFVDYEAGAVIVVFAALPLVGIFLASDADMKLREHVRAEQLAEKIKTQIERLRQSVPE